MQRCFLHHSPMSVTVSLLCVCDNKPSSFSDSESCRESFVLLRLPARRMDDREPPFFTLKLRAPLIWSSREPPIRIFLIGTEEGKSEDNIFQDSRCKNYAITAVCSTWCLTLTLLHLLLFTCSVRLERVAAAVERVVSILIIQDACKADLPLISVTTELWV